MQKTEMVSSKILGSVKFVIPKVDEIRLKTYEKLQHLSRTYPYGHLCQLASAADSRLGRGYVRFGSHLFGRRRRPLLSRWLLMFPLYVFVWFIGKAFRSYTFTPATRASAPRPPPPGRRTFFSRPRPRPNH